MQEDELDLKGKIDSFLDGVVRVTKEIMHLRYGLQPLFLLALLDGLSYYAFPEKKRNRCRFKCLIDQYSGWQDKDRVSLAQLKHLIHEARTQGAAEAELLTEIHRRLEQWPDALTNQYAPGRTCDPLASDLNKYKTGSCTALIERARYVSLLWAMRNRVIHEIVNPSVLGTYIQDESTPYYVAGVGRESGEPAQYSWRLCIPPKVIFGVVRGCAANLGKEFQRRGYSPDDMIPSTGSWYKRWIPPGAARSESDDGL